MIQVKNRRVVIPFANDIELSVSSNISTYNRGANIYSTTANNAFQISLPFLPLCTELTEVFVNHMRLINPKVQDIIGGTQYQEYNVSDNNIDFENSLTGDIRIVCEMQPMPEYNAITILINNSQGFKSAGISLFHEPVVLTEPLHGYARLSFDRKELIYQPKLNFIGQDSFSYTLINNQGQYGKPKCIFITVS